MKLQISVDGITFGSNITEVVVPEALRHKRSTGIKYMDDAFGGLGMTPSMVTLFSGESGAGKTTLMVAVAEAMARRGNVVVYNTAEESAYQLRMAYDRVVGNAKSGFLLGQCDHVGELLEQCDEIRRRNPTKPFILIQDSLQAMDDGYFKSGRITSATSTRVLQKLTNWTKTRLEGAPSESAFANSIVIGQVTKNGKMAGANQLRHMVDAVIHMDIDDNDKSEWYDCRRLMTEKNRFGGAGYLSLLRMTSKGLDLVAQTSNVVTGTDSATEELEDGEE